MNSIPVFLRKLFLVLNKFSNPGYLITIKAEDVDSAVIDKTKGTIKDNDFITVVEDTDGVLRNTVMSEYVRKGHHLIWVSLYYSKLEYPERRVNLKITIENRYKGREPAMKSAIDELESILFDELSRFVSRDRLLIVRQITSPDY